MNLKKFIKNGRWKGNRSGDISVSRNGTRGLNSSTRGLTSSGPLKDGHGDEAFIDNDTSDGGVPLAAKQAFGGEMVTDDFQRMNDNEPSREEISYDLNNLFTTKSNNGGVI